MTESDKSAEAGFEGKIRELARRDRTNPRPVEGQRRGVIQLTKIIADGLTHLKEVPETADVSE